MTSNPNYAELLPLIAQETDPVVKQQLIAQASVVNIPLTPEEASLFDYCEPGYISNNPGYVANNFSSYIGIYIDQDGVYTGIYP